MLLGGISLGTSVGAVLYHLHPIALFVFLGSVAIAVAVSIAFHWHLAEWYFSRSRKDADGT